MMVRLDFRIFAVLLVVAAAWEPRGLLGQSSSGTNVSVGHDAFYAIKTILNKLALAPGAGHRSFVYFDFAGRRKIVVRNDYVEESGAFSRRASLNKNYLYTRIYVNTSNTYRCQKKSCFTALEFEDVGNSPLVLCSYLPEDFYECQSILDKHISATNCTKFGLTDYGSVQETTVLCRALEGIECRGNRTFEKQVPCVKYSEKHFVSILLYSIFLGIFAVDRFCIGQTGIGIGKLITFGGFGIWYLADIVLLVLGYIKPSDNSNYAVYY